MALPLQERLDEPLGRLGRQEPVDQAHRALVQRAAGGTGRIALDPPVRGVGRLAGDAGERERTGVDPGTVSVTVRQERRAIGHDGVEVLCRRCASGERRHLPSAPEDPLVVRVRGRIPGDPVEVLLAGGQSGQIAAEHVQPAPHRVHVRVLETGHQQSAGEVDHLGLRPDQRRDVVPHRADEPVRHGDRVRRGARGIGEEHPPSAHATREDQICVSHPQPPAIVRAISVAESPALFRTTATSASANSVSTSMIVDTAAISGRKPLRSALST